ncbi:glycosyltransferase family 4 protein [Halorientalis brevis]|uniref:Glycosyltransferase family 4 protein n=1 Tax=Halorientalis brevis TaxID=1126241 RepID=A0ABD6CDN9_9EURY|nr:glycosyltransferase family 4 protein [Halorientalis brevis]
MKIGFAVYGGLDNTSGGFHYDRRLVEQLRARGDTVEVIDLPWPSYPRQFLHNARPSIHRRLAGDFDVVLQDELCHPSLFRINHRLGRARPVVSVVHHLTSSEARGSLAQGLYRQVERAYLATVDGAICNSATTAASVTALADVPTQVAPPAGDRFEPDVDRATVRERARTDPFHVLFLGNLVPRKNVETLLRAVAGLSPPPEVTIVGDETVEPDYTRRLRAAIDELGLDAAVTLTGRLPDDAVAAHLARAHLLVVPSEYEGFGIVYLEAMGFGVPPVATTAGGASEFVTDGENGRLVPPDDPKAIARVVESLRTDRDRLERLSLAALDRYAEHPTWEESMAGAREFVAAVAESNQSAPAASSGGLVDG